ncbi:MAG: hypothetical protein UU65_C0001G0247 [candidate division CPR2 bacterium GW2011_GWC1_41_48]|uniref:Uncharacterized protein n=1 Tax=candidate division CPR2 bacterium GW2011_GWC1_41_48 TaxID=1618344 RepID=A0A0G0WCQ6_UNCC2|nr:MAG: hypothetical protein UT47_C0001G0247 [candidate division CPR2 bacterium GW2011_GWC2_39_35]KKR28011.1 MAG: hypothetical protein UT60_C0030G0012 [candidate division CPR2 bacterium GW2011_GWD2_39_7]KKR28411.1 MAG: hypothetical protein UT59_C0028G0005 [candidate division CPR2 bacterium GW2011_GWD1_39_7]KKS09842.1 MAG: hypothetical protein UU65_C0001G0247 [candidate division CPR2 bacterium GW2011_GWC1_41_48]
MGAVPSSVLVDTGTAQKAAEAAISTKAMATNIAIFLIPIVIVLLVVVINRYRSRETLKRAAEDNELKMLRKLEDEAEAYANAKILDIKKALPALKKQFIAEFMAEKNHLLVTAKVQEQRSRVKARKDSAEQSNTVLTNAIPEIEQEIMECHQLEDNALRLKKTLEGVTTRL